MTGTERGGTCGLQEASELIQLRELQTRVSGLVLKLGRVRGAGCIHRARMYRTGMLLLLGKLEETGECINEYGHPRSVATVTEYVDRAEEWYRCLSNESKA